MHKDLRIDAYIARSNEFAVPILEHLRKLIHESSAEIEESIKWGFPHFLYKGKIVCSMAAFKQHCAFTFWKAEQLKDRGNLLDLERKDAMGHFGRITKLSDLPSDEQISDLIRQCTVLIDSEKKLVRK